MFLLLVVAGNETTRQAIAHGMQALMDYPDELERLRADPALMPTAVEEILRWSTPVLHFRRTATRDTELRGAPIKAGDKVVTWYASANFDERVFDDPLRFDVGRKPQRPRQLRPRRPALLPGRAPGQARGQDHVRGAAPAARVDRADRPVAAHPHQLHQRPQARCPCASPRHERISRVADSTLIALEQRGVRTVRITYPDLHGISRGKDYPLAHFAHVVGEGGGVLRGDHDRRPAPQRRRRARARLPGHPRPARSGHARAGAVGAGYRLVPGRPLPHGRLAVRGRSARGGAPRGRGLRRARPHADRRPGARVLPVRARPGRRRRAIAATWTTRATSTRSATRRSARRC